MATTYYYVLGDSGRRLNAVTEMGLLLTARLDVAGAEVYLQVSCMLPHSWRPIVAMLPLLTEACSWGATS